MMQATATYQLDLFANKTIADTIEVWKDITGYEGIYQVSNMGRIKSLSKTMHGKVTAKHAEKIRKQSVSEKGYLMISLSKEGKHKTYKVHRIVGKHFLAPVSGRIELNHRDGNKLNCAASNLEWSTRRLNILHAYANNLIKANSGADHHNSRAVIQFTKSGEKINEFECISTAAKTLRINGSNITTCCIGKRNYCGGFKWQYR